MLKALKLPLSRAEQAETPEQDVAQANTVAAENSRLNDLLRDLMQKENAMRSTIEGQGERIKTLETGLTQQAEKLAEQANEIQRLRDQLVSQSGLNGKPPLPTGKPPQSKFSELPTTFSRQNSTTPSLTKKDSGHASTTQARRW